MTRLVARIPKRNLFHIFLILLAGMAVYANSFRVGFVLDDDAAISTYGPQSIIKIMLHGGPRRIVDATFALNHTLHGEEVVGYHMFNLLIHLTAAVTIYLLASASLTALRASFAPPETPPETPTTAERFIPCAVSLLFVLHPLQTQSVTYIVQRYTSMATLFYLMAALFFIRTRLAYEREGMSPRMLLATGATIVTALLALGSKQIAATLPLMLTALEVFLFRGRLLGRRFFLLCGAGLLLGIAALLSFAWHGLSPREMLAALHNATSEHHGLSRSGYFFTQLRVVATYLQLFLFPWGQSLFHEIPFATSIFSLPTLAAGLLHLALIGAAVNLFRSSATLLGSDSWEKGALQRMAALGIAWFYIGLIVESSVFPITDWIFEHRVYLPSVGLFLAVTSLALLQLAGRCNRLRPYWAALAVIAVILGSLTLLRNRVWSDSFLLWQDTVDKAPNKDLALANLAGEYMKLDQPDKALPLFVRALELNPRFMTSTKVYLGMTLQRLNVDGSRFVTGEEFLPLIGQRQLNQQEEKRINAILYNNLGVAHDILGAQDKAQRAYKQALKINPDFDLAWYNLGLLAEKTGDREQLAKALGELQRLGSPRAIDLTTN